PRTSRARTTPLRSVLQSGYLTSRSSRCTSRARATSARSRVSDVTCAKGIVSLSIIAAALVHATTLRAQFLVDQCKSTVSVNGGVFLVCPKGDGDPLTSTVGGGSSQITLTLRDNANVPIADVPAEDMWLVGCSNGLLLCGLSSGSQADHPTNA